MGDANDPCGLHANGPAGPDVKQYYDLLEGRLRQSFLQGVECNEPAVKQFAAKIEGSDVEYPGQVKITVIRETRATEYAK